MKSSDVVLLGYKLMAEHGVYDWSFKLDRSKSRFGICYYSKKVISLSEQLCDLNSKKEVTNTILHEIAHALAGERTGHGWKWKQIARNLGCDTERLYSKDDVKIPERNITIECPECQHIWKRYRRLVKARRYACPRCKRDKGTIVVLICYANRKERTDALNEKKILSDLLRDCAL